MVDIILFHSKCSHFTAHGQATIYPAKSRFVVELPEKTLIINE